MRRNKIVRVKVFKIAVFSVLCLYCAAILGEEGVSKEKVFDTFSDLVLKESPFENEEITHSNGFKIGTIKIYQLDGKFEKTENDGYFLTATHRDSKDIAVKYSSGQKGVPIVAIGDKNTRTSRISVGDYNRDGVIDFLMYSIDDENGNPILAAEDYGADSIIDFRIKFKENIVEVNYKGKWYTAEKGVIIVNGEKLRVKNVLQELGRPE